MYLNQKMGTISYFKTINNLFSGILQNVLEPGEKEIFSKQKLFH